MWPASCSAEALRSAEASRPSRAAGIRSRTRAARQALPSVGSRPDLVFMVRMIVYSGASDGVKGGSMTLACMSGRCRERQQLSGARSLFTAGPAAASAGVLAVQVATGDGRVDGPGHRDDAAGGIDAAPGDRLQAAGLQGEAEVHRLDRVPQQPRAGQVE